MEGWKGVRGRFELWRGVAGIFYSARLISIYSSHAGLVYLISLLAFTVTVLPISVVILPAVVVIKQLTSQTSPKLGDWYSLQLSPGPWYFLCHRCVLIIFRLVK